MDALESSAQGPSYSARLGSYVVLPVKEILPDDFALVTKYVGPQRYIGWLPLLPSILVYIYCIHPSNPSVGSLFGLPRFSGSAAAAAAPSWAFFSSQYNMFQKVLCVTLML